MGLREMISTAKYTLLIIPLALILTAPIHAKEYSWDSAGAFSRVCGAADGATNTSADVLADYTGCVAYLRGMHDAIWDLASAPPYCAPGSVTVDEEMKVMLKYLRDNPAKLHLEIPALYRSAMKQAFPCVAKSRTPPVDFSAGLVPKASTHK